MSTDNGIAMIDHKFFPDIIDSIVSHLDYGGLKAAASAGGAWHNLAQRLKDRLAHIDITNLDEEEGLTLFFYETRDQHERRLFHVVLDMATATDPFLVNLFKTYVRAVDIPDMGFSDEQWECLRTWVENTAVVRCMASEGQALLPVTANTLVIFHDAVSNCESPHILMEDVEGILNADHLVVNLDCYANPVDYESDMTSVLNEEWDANTRYLTVILHDRTGEPSEVQEYSVALVQGYMENALNEITRVTIVGLELFIPDPRRLEHFKREAVRLVLEENCRRLSRKQRKHRWFFYTHEEYKRILGEEMYKLYTVK